MLFSALYKLRNFGHDNRGNVGIIFGLLILPLMMAAAAAVDFSAMSMKKTELQTIADAASVAGLSDPNIYLTDQQKIDRTKQFLSSQLSSRKLTDVTQDVTYVKEVMQVNLTAPYSMFFGSILSGPTTIGVNSKATNGRPADKVSVLQVVMCVNARFTMADELAGIKKQISSFQTTLNAEMKARGKGSYDRVHMKIIEFRDYNFGVGSKTIWHPMVENNFVDIPNQSVTVEKILSNISPQDPTDDDDKDSGHECFFLALKSKWLKVGDKYPYDNNPTIVSTKSVIMLWTDQDAKTPRAIYNSATYWDPIYPKDMPITEAGIAQAWNNPAYIDQKGKSFVLYGPCVNYNWQIILKLSNTACGGNVTTSSTAFIKSLADSIVKTGISEPGLPPRFIY